jgi:hypothetical protein
LELNEAASAYQASLLDRPFGGLRNREEMESFFIKREHSSYLGLAEKRHGPVNQAYSQKIGAGLSGRGLRHDGHQSGQKILEILSAGGTDHDRRLIHTYIHGKIPFQRKPFRHRQANMIREHNEQLTHQGGKLPQSENLHPHILLV